MNHIIVVEAAQNMQYGIGLPDIAQKLISEALTFTRPFDQTRNINDFYGGRYHFLWIDQLFKLFQSAVWHIDHTDIGLNGAKGKIGALCLGIRETIEKG